jgi:ubiquinone/menaquinone biosynthesis C-methylase UbiE
MPAPTSALATRNQQPATPSRPRLRSCLRLAAKPDSLTQDRVVCTDAARTQGIGWRWLTNVHFARATVEALPFRAGLFDAAICAGSLNHFSDTVLALREINCTMKVGCTGWSTNLAKPLLAPCHPTVWVLLGWARQRCFGSLAPNRSSWRGPAHYELTAKVVRLVRKTRATLRG